MVSFAHIVNPLVIRNSNSDLVYAQPITLKSMKQAAHRARSEGIEVEQLATTYPEDDAAIPDSFVRTPHLEESVLDHVRSGPGEPSRKLPLLREILDRLYHGAPHAEFMIYSNIDIGLQPDFYIEIERAIREHQWDAFSVMRHTVSDEHRAVEEIDLIHELPGVPQGGYSCLVFRRSDYPKYALGSACIGLQPVSVLLMLNMMIHAKRFGQIKKQRLCFHLGDDGNWRAQLLNSVHRWNEHQLDVFLEAARRKIDRCPQARTLLGQYLERRAGFVIYSTRSPLKRMALRTARRLGLINWINRGYQKSE